MPSVSIAICAYNERNNIEKSVRSAYAQKMDNDFTLEEVIVVSSGSTDGTDDLVTSLVSEYSNLKLIVQEKRRGKNVAINEALDFKTGDVTVLLNADNIFAYENSLISLVLPFKDPTVGVVGGRPIPTNNITKWAGYASHLIWTMHHRISEVHPKVGEIVAFRDIGTRLPEEMQSDEDIIKMKLEQGGYHAVYSPDAVVFNRGPDNIKDFIKQRTRVNIGEMHLKKNFAYKVPTWNKNVLVDALVGSLGDLGFHPFKATFAISLEALARARAYVYVKMGKNDKSVWDQIKSTKKV